MSDPRPRSDGPRPATRPGDTSRRGRIARGLTGLAIGLALWWLATAVLAPAGSLLARFEPVAASAALTEFVTSTSGRLHVLVTLQRLAIGLVLAAVIGLPVGLAVGSSPRLAEATGPVFQFVRMVSPLAWTPIAIIVFGVGDAPVYFLVGIAALWPILLNTVAGVHALDPGWRLVARGLGASRWELVRSIVLPGIRGHVVTGLRVALGIAWLVIVPAEMLGVDSGLGYAILDARDRLSYDELMAVIVLIGMLGFVLDAGAQALVRTTGPRRTGVDPASGPLQPLVTQPDDELSPATP